MIRKKKTCKCGCKREGFIWSQGMLKECFLRLNPSKKNAYKSAKQKIKDVEKKNRTIKLHEWFLEIWDKRKEKDEFGYFVRCFETEQKLYEQYYKFNTCCYSHYYPKNNYQEYAMKEWNIEIIHPNVHSQWELNKQKCIKMYSRWLYLQKNIGILFK